VARRDPHLGQVLLKRLSARRFASGRIDVVVPQIERLTGGARPSGIVHFRGAGNAARTFAQMQRYLDEITGA
jgi:hypothetical protein